MFPCKYKQENQYFRYDPGTRQIYCGRMRDNLCIDSDPAHDKVFYANCDAAKATQRWIFGTTNMTMLSNWAAFGKPIKDPEERRDFGLEVEEGNVIEHKKKKNHVKKEDI